MYFDFSLYERYSSNSAICLKQQCKQLLSYPVAMDFEGGGTLTSDLGALNPDPCFILKLTLFGEPVERGQTLSIFKF